MPVPALCGCVLAQQMLFCRITGKWLDTGVTNGEHGLISGCLPFISPPKPVLGFGIQKIPCSSGQLGACLGETGSHMTAHTTNVFICLSRWCATLPVVGQRFGQFSILGRWDRAPSDAVLSRYQPEPGDKIPARLISLVPWSLNAQCGIDQAADTRSSWAISGLKTPKPR